MSPKNIPRIVGEDLSKAVMGEGDELRTVDAVKEVAVYGFEVELFYGPSEPEFDVLNSPQSRIWRSSWMTSKYDVPEVRYKKCNIKLYLINEPSICAK